MLGFVSKAPRWALPEYFEVDDRGRCHGGYYCMDCEFANAGTYPAELVDGLDMKG